MGLPSQGVACAILIAHTAAFLCIRAVTTVAALLLQQINTPAQLQLTDQQFIATDSNQQGPTLW